MPVKIDSDIRLAASPQNRTAGQLFKRARVAAEVSQGDFGKQVARRLGMSEISQSAVSDWERGKRQVPAAAIIAAAEVAHMDPAELFVAESKRITAADRLLRDIEKIAGTLTAAQQARIRAVK